MSALFKAAYINNRLIVAQTLGKVLLICSLHFYVIHAAVAVGNPHIKAYALCIACLVECFLISYIANRPDRVCKHHIQNRCTDRLILHHRAKHIIVGNR